MYAKRFKLAFWAFEARAPLSLSTKDSKGLDESLAWSKALI